MENKELLKQTGTNIIQNHPAQPATLNLYVHLATSDNTRKAYRSDIRHYEMWGGKLPATTDMIAGYLHYYADKLNSRTLNRRLIALKHWHTYQGFSDATLHPVIRKIMTGIIKTHGKPKEKAHPITLSEIIKIHQHLTADGSFASIRDDALLQIGYFGALRRSELVSIRVEDIRFEKSGIEITLPTSKTDPTHEGQFCVVPYGNSTICPIKTLKAWLEISNITTGVIFRRIKLGDHLGDDKLTPLSVNFILKKRAKEAAIENADLLSAHSLRRGLATSAAQSGASLQSIMRAGRWKQANTAIEYVEANDRFKDNAAFSVLKTID